MMSCGLSTGLCTGSGKGALQSQLRDVAVNSGLGLTFTDFSGRQRNSSRIHTVQPRTSKDNTLSPKFSN